MLARYNIPEDDSKKIEACRYLSGLYVKVYVLILVNLLLLSIKFFINAQI